MPTTTNNINMKEYNDSKETGIYLANMIIESHASNNNLFEQNISVAVGNDMKSVIDQLQSSADQLVDGAKCNDMDLNVSKTKVMIFGNTSDKVKIMIEGSERGQVRSYNISWSYTRYRYCMILVLILDFK